MERAPARDIAERLPTILWWSRAMERASARGLRSRAMERAPARDIAERLRIVSLWTTTNCIIVEQSHGTSASERHCGATTNCIIVDDYELYHCGAEPWNERQREILRSDYERKCG
jgi:hypothetical protein